ncbi:unnamed protein product [Moneuplotes crassus]|uniref:aspartate--tRNA ligase n=1 Tax=Euplotes crassus TaxID=5936 RepID=A0AAD1U9F5_EUPCR|nr:unnamed protein product [Moneuplotes crassus]
MSLLLTSRLSLYKKTSFRLIRNPIRFFGLHTGKYEQYLRMNQKKETLRELELGLATVQRRFMSQQITRYGDLEMVRSTGEYNKERKFLRMKDITSEMEGQTVKLRARVHRTTGKGKAVFLILRENFSTMQACMFSNDVEQEMLDYTRRIPKESIVIIEGTVQVPHRPIKKCTEQVEILINGIWNQHSSLPRLPLNLDDASNIVRDQTLEDDLIPENQKVGKKKKKGRQSIVVGQNTRLNNRILDLRVPANQAIMRISAGICRFFREYLQDNDFVEIHSPKLIGGTSEGGSEVFRLDYFGSDACLAQSPQLYKQMAVVSDFERVFEIGPVFRAENSLTPRHLCEFTGLDLEMSFDDHYFEVVDLISEMFGYIFERLNEKYRREIDAVQQQYPFKEFIFKPNVPKIKFTDACEILKKAGFHQDPLKDLGTENEEKLGKIVKKKYKTDFFIVYNYPAEARPFYSMINPNDPEYTNSYDFFMRGQEILSGAQRIHDPEMLAERAIVKGIQPETIQDYIDCFKYGAYPHAGGGIGLERVLKLFLGIHNIRKCSMFPRDPKRLTP